MNSANKPWTKTEFQTVAGWMIPLHKAAGNKFGYDAFINAMIWDQVSKFGLAEEGVRDYAVL